MTRSEAIRSRRPPFPGPFRTDRGRRDRLGAADHLQPATGRIAREVDFASSEEVDTAVAAARAAFTTWRATSISKRTEILFRIRNLVEANRREIASILTTEHGKVPSDALGEIARGLENLEVACGLASQLKGGFSEQASGGIDVYQIRQPLGVVAGITPFNFPAMVPMWMFGNAIACGNAFILKPSEKDPSAALFLAELLREAGVPDGVFSVVQGDKVAVDRILEHRTSRRCRSSARHRSPATSTRPGPATASASRPSAVPRTT
jgi:malonate-semialdehyde dehydrogenase (acetylating)/methylmalonate-semialdehyde dehydrogenase